MSRNATRRPSILLIEEDDETRSLLRQNLERAGYRVLIAIDEQDAFDRVEGERVPADLLLVNLVGKTPAEALSVGRRVRKHAQYDGHTPLVVLAEKYARELEGTNVEVGGNDWIVYLGEELKQLQNLLARLTSKDEG